MHFIEPAIAEGTGSAFSLARQIAISLLKRAIEGKLRKIVEQEVQTAVFSYLETAQASQPTGSIQIVIGEVYNIAERFNGVVKVGQDLHFEKETVSIDPAEVDNPTLGAVIHRAQVRLEAASGADAHHDPGSSLLAPSIPSVNDQGGGLTFDSEQRMSRRAAEGYREQLLRLAREDQVR